MFALNLLVFGPDMNEHVLSHLADIKAKGYDGIEIPIFNTDVAFYKVWKEAAMANDLAIMTCSFCSADQNMISSDPTIREQAVSFLKKGVDVTAYLGGNLFSGPFQSALGVFSGASRTDQELAWAKEGITALANYAQEKEVTIGLEYLNRFETYLVSSAEELYSLVKDINHPNVKIMFDTFHANIEETNTAHALKSIQDEMVHIQFSESHRGILGEGQVHWPEIMAAVKEINYKGWIVVESFGITLPAACIWRKTFTSEVDNYTKSMKFLKENY